MEFISKLERTILKWAKNVPHLPSTVRRWVGDNVWWIALVGAILSGVSVLVTFIGIMGAFAIMGTSAAAYYVTTSIIGWQIVVGIVSIVFAAIDAILLGIAAQPLREKQKKGWVLLFLVWLISALSVVVGAVLSLNPIGFIGGLLFGAVWLAASGYFLFEIHGEFAHTEKSKGLKPGRE